MSKERAWAIAAALLDATCVEAACPSSDGQKVQIKLDGAWVTVELDEGERLVQVLAARAMRELREYIEERSPARG